MRYSDTAYLIEEKREETSLLCWENRSDNTKLVCVPVEMMCDTVNRSFRAQLAAILDKLTKAALLEIGSLADECSAILHTEISQHKTENEALRKRCYSLEVQLRAAREAHGYSGTRPQTAGQDDRKRFLLLNVYIAQEQRC